MWWQGCSCAWRYGRVIGAREQTLTVVDVRSTPSGGGLDGKAVCAREGAGSGARRR